MKKTISLSGRIILTIAFILFSHEAFGESPALLKGIEQYKQENYEEAIELLKKACEAEPGSSVAAFMLGLSYKQTMEYDKALPHLRAAATLRPGIKDAVVELAYICLRSDKTEEAKKWIEVAEKEEIFPAKTAFLKGLILQKEGKIAEAVPSFERAKSLDPSLTQSAEYNIALSYLKDRKFKAARKRLETAIQYDPRTDLATFARRYQDMLERRIALERPIRLTFAMFGQYDTNVVLKPTDSQAASSITNEESPALATNVRLDYVPYPEGPWLFNAQYSYYGRLHKKNATTHDTVTNSFYVAPGYNFGNYSVSLAGRYTHSLLRDPSYKHYLDEFSVGPMFRTLLGSNHIVELYTGYVSREYMRQALKEEEDRDSDSLSTYLSWIWLFGEESFFNFRYEYSDEHTYGENWENRGHRFSVSTSVPLADKVKLQLSGDTFLQDFKHEHTDFKKKRADAIYQLSAGLTWEFLDNTLLIGQYNRSRADSDISIYDYKREIYTLGIERRF